MYLFLQNILLVCYGTDTDEDGIVSAHADVTPPVGLPYWITANVDRRTDGHHQSISRNRFEIRPQNYPKIG